MLYNPKEDKIQAKQISFSNGKKMRGELKSLQEQLIVVNTSNDNVREKVKELLTKLPKTLRTLLSYCNSFYDLTGCIMSLHNKLRAITIDLMINGRRYDDMLDNDSWKHFEICLFELIKAKSYKYKRRPNEEDLKQDGLILHIYSKKRKTTPSRLHSYRHEQEYSIILYRKEN